MDTTIKTKRLRPDALLPFNTVNTEPFGLHDVYDYPVHTERIAA